MKCIICQKDNIKPLGFSKHIKQHGYTSKSYYDKFIHTTSGKCLECNKSTRFVSITEGYKQFCSQKCAMQNSLVKEKISIRTKSATEDIKRRNIEKYGVEWITKLDSQKKKSKQTLLKHYGVDSPMKSELIREKHRKSTKNHLGVEYASQSKLIQKKTKKTCLDKYGVCSPVLIEDVHTKAIKLAWSEESKNKRKTTCNNKYGVDYVCTTDYIQKKAHSKKAYEKKRNSTRQTLINKKLNSAEQLFSDLAKKNKLDYEYLYSSTEYPYLCDFYIPKKNLYIEVNIFWTHGHHWVTNKKEDKQIVETWKSKNNKFYNNAIYTWTDLDVRKRKIARKNKLNYVVLWSVDDIYEWFELNCPIGHDYEKEYSWKKQRSEQKKW